VEEASTTHDWVVRCKSKNGAEEIRSFKLSGKEKFFNYEITKSKEVKKEQKHKGYLSWVERTIQVMVETRQYQNGGKRGPRFTLGLQRSYCHDKMNSGPNFVNNSEGVG